VSVLVPAPRARRGILAGAGGTHAPRAPPAPSRRAHRARARARVRLEGFGCAARPATAQRDPRAGGARARPDAERGSTCSRDPPSHAPHARRARGGRARASRWGLGGGIQRTAPLNPVLWAPRPSGVLAWLSCVRGASRSGTRGAGTRESHFGGRHRTFRYRIRRLRGVRGSGGPRRGTWRPDMLSRRVEAVFIRIRGWSCTDRSSSRGPLHALPAALRPPQSEERSDQIRGTGVTRGPRRPKGPVMGSQAHGGHPAAASRPGTPTYKFITTRLRTLTPPPPHARRAPLAVTTCAPSAPHATAGSTSPSGACSACA
jgi:hypothetical protein